MAGAYRSAVPSGLDVKLAVTGVWWAGRECAQAAVGLGVVAGDQLGGRAGQLLVQPGAVVRQGGLGLGQVGC